MSKKCDMQEVNYNEMLRDLWCNAWHYTLFTSKWKPTPDGFYRYMGALRRHIDMLEKRIEDLENARSKT